MPAQGKAKSVFVAERCKEIQVIRFKRNQAVQVNELESSHLLLKSLDSVSIDATIKVVIFFGEPDIGSEPEALGI